MNKKILSLILATAVLVSAMVPMFLVPSSALAYGSEPFRNAENATYKTVFTPNGKAYNDFVALRTVDDYTDANFYNSASRFALHNTTSSPTFNKGDANVTMSIDETSNNIYGDKGKSLKLSYSYVGGKDITPANAGTLYYHWVRMQISNAPEIPELDKASFGFWVKTSEPIYFYARLYIGDEGASNGTNAVFTKRVSIAGEGFVEIPFATFENNSSNCILDTVEADDIKYIDIFFKSQATESYEGTRDIWFDHIGYYNYATESVANLYDEDFTESTLTKEDVEGYAYSTDYKVASGSKYYTASSGRGTDNGLRVCDADSLGNNANAYAGKGQSIYYFSNYVNIDTSTTHRIQSSAKINNKNSENVQADIASTLEFYIKTDRAIWLKLTADDTYEKVDFNHRWQTDYQLVPAGESVIKIPLSEFDEKYNASYTHLEYFIWEYLNAINFYFYSAVADTSAYGGVKKINVYLDEIRILPRTSGDTNDDCLVDIRELLSVKKASKNGETANENNNYYTDAILDNNDIKTLREYLLGLSTQKFVAPTEA